MMTKKFIYLAVLFTGMLGSCKSPEKTTGGTSIPTGGVGNRSESHVVVYKTIRDYSDLVPVIMNNEKTQIVSYPHPVDLFYKGQLAKPTVLKNGYLLDNRGINENVVFLNITYEEYSRLPQAPLLEELLLRIADKNPLTEMIDCGARSQYKDIIKELNILVDAGFPGCKRASNKSFPIGSD